LAPSGTATRTSFDYSREVIVIAFALPGSMLVWIVLIQVWIFLLWYRPARNPFTRRLDQLLALLLPETELTRSRLITAAGKGTIREQLRSTPLNRLRGFARRWRAQLQSMYAQGYQVASETIVSSGEVARGHELVRETVSALKAERAGGAATAPTTEDPVVVLAYGLGAWPSGADLTSLEQLLKELGVSQPILLSRFDSLIRTVTTANQNRDFRELAGASFVLGAAARILEAAATPDKSLPPPGWLATLTTHLR
jgi:hypothetical protein